MSDITQRIADIIRAEYDKRPAGKYPTEHSLAEVLTTELGLTREERTRGMGSTTVAWRPCTRQERWVTAWTVTEFSANA